MQKIDINLITLKRSGSRFPAIAGFVFLALAIVYTWYNIDAYVENRRMIVYSTERITNLEESLPFKDEEGARFSATEKNLKFLRNEVEFINNVIAKETFSWSELLSNLETCVPQNVSIVQISPNFSDGKIEIAGIAKKMKDIFFFVDDMGRSPHFRDVFLLKHSSGGINTLPRDVSVMDEVIVFNVSAIYKVDK